MRCCCRTCWSAARARLTLHDLNRLRHASTSRISSRVEYKYSRVSTCLSFSPLLCVSLFFRCERMLDRNIGILPRNLKQSIMALDITVTELSHGGWKVMIVAVVLIVMQSLMVIGRFISRKMQKAALAADDYILLLATILTITLCGIAIACELRQHLTSSLVTNHRQSQSPGSPASAHT